MKKLLIIAFIMLTITACDAVDDMKGMFEKQEAAQTMVKEKYGWESQLGFNMSNGILTQVTLALDANDVRNETVSTLEKIAKDVTAATFKSTPNTINIQITSIPDEKS